MNKKLKDLLGEVFEETQKVDKYKVSEGVRNYGIVGKTLYSNSNIMEVATQLAKIAEQAHHHILGESDDWFDKISINKNMKHLKGSVMEFTKTAKEANMLNQRLTGLYEDIGHVLNRYYDIDEALDPVDTDEVEPEDDFEDRKDKDIDNDGETDDQDKFLHKKRKAITKAVKGEALDMDKAPDGGGDEEDLAARDGEDMKEGFIRLKDIASGIVGIKPIGTTIVNK